MKSIAEVNNARSAVSESQKIVEKILEFEILDLFWFEVLRKHPELQLDAQGSKLSLPRNNEVNNCIARVSNTFAKRTVSDVACARELVASVDCCGVFCLAEGNNLQEHDSLNLFDVDITREITAEDDNGPLILSPLCNFRISCTRVMSPANQLLGDEVAKRSFVHSRFVVVNIVLPETVVVEGAPVDPKKKKPAAAAGGAKGAPLAEVEKKAYYRVLILDAVGTSPAFIGAKQASFRVKVVHELLLDCPSTVLVPTELASLKFDLGQSLDSRKDMFDGLSVDLSLDGTLLSVVCASYHGGCKVFSLQPTTECELTPSSDSAVESGKAPPLQLSRPPVAAVVPKTAPFLMEAAIKSVTILPSSGMSSNTSSNVNNCCRMLITLQKSPRCMVVELRAKSAEEMAVLQQQQQTAAASTTAVGKAAKGPPLPNTKALDDVPLCSVCLLARWSLPSALTAYAVDPHTRSLLTLGCADGTVELWNLESLSLVDTIGRHKDSSVTCLSVKRNPLGAASALRQVGVTVLSGAADGTLCSYSVVAESGGGGVEHMRVHDYRFDAADAAVMNIQQVHGHSRSGELLADPLTSALALVQYSNGLAAIYEAPANGAISLLGRLEKRERISFETICTSFYSWNTLPPFEDPVKKVAAVKAAEVAAAIAAQEAEAARLLAAQKAAAEAEKAEKAAAKGGKDKDKAAHVAVAAEPVSEPVEEVAAAAEEPYRYVPAPEDVQENQIDMLDYADVTKVIAAGCSGASAQWQAHRSILSLSTKGDIVCSGDRGGEPCLVVYELADFLRRGQNEKDTAAEMGNINMGPAPRQQQQQLKQKASNPQLLTRTDTKSTQQLQQLKLTEQHLLSLEAGMVLTTSKNTSASVAGTVKGVRQQQQLLQSPEALARASIARSRHEKQSRKNVLLNNAAALSSLLLQQHQESALATTAAQR